MKIRFLTVFALSLTALILWAGCFNITVQPPDLQPGTTGPASPVNPPVTEPKTPPVPPPAIPAPKVNVFSAAPGSIVAGSSSKLTWEVTDASSVTITPGVGTVALSGSTNVSPAFHTDYLLTAVGPGGTAYASTQIGVYTIIGLPVIISFTANPPSLYFGSSTLSWNVSNATSVTISQGIGSVGSSGTRSVTPAVTTNYTLTASNPAGTVYQTIQVTKLTIKMPTPVVPLEPIPLPKFPIDPLPKFPLDPIIPKF